MTNGLRVDRSKNNESYRLRGWSGVLIWFQSIQGMTFIWCLPLLQGAPGFQLFAFCQPLTWLGLVALNHSGVGAKHFALSCNDLPCTKYSRFVWSLGPGTRKVLIQHVDIQCSGRLEPKARVIASWTQWFAQWVVLLHKSASTGKHCNEITRWCSCWIDHVVSSRVEYWTEWWIIVPWYFMNTCFIEFKSNCRIVARSKWRHRRKNYYFEWGDVMMRGFSPVCWKVR